MLDSSMSAALQKLQEMYSSNNFQAGVDLLLETRADWNPAQFHELLGSFYMKLENYAAARYHLELAIQKGGASPSITHNLDYVMSQMSLVSSSYVAWWERAYDTMSLLPFEFWAALTLLFLSAALWRFRWRWQSGSRVLIISLWIIAAIPQVLYWGLFESRVSAIVLEETALYEGPSSVFAAPKTLRAGEKVIIGNGGDGWSFIIAPQVLSGWVESANLGFLGRK